MCIDQGMAIAPWGAVGQGKFKSQAELEKRTEEVRYGGQTASEARISSALEDVANELGGGVSLQSVAIAWSSKSSSTPLCSPSQLSDLTPRARLPSVCKMPHLFPIGQHALPSPRAPPADRTDATHLPPRQSAARASSICATTSAACPSS